MTDDNRGWFGTSEQVLHTLRTFGCDRDHDGRFIITGDAPCSFLGLSGDVVVPPDCTCYIDGKPTSVVGLLAQTSYGLKVTVIT